MVAAGTVDEDIYLTGERKKEVNESVLNDSGNKKEKDAASTISGACFGSSRTAKFARTRKKQRGVVNAPECECEDPIFGQTVARPVCDTGQINP